MTEAIEATEVGELLPNISGRIVGPDREHLFRREGHIALRVWALKGVDPPRMSLEVKLGDYAVVVRTDTAVETPEDVLHGILSALKEASVGMPANPIESINRLMAALEHGD